MNLLLTLNPEEVTEEEAQEFRYRETARAVALDEDGNIPVLYARTYDFYTLPGGGKKDGETIYDALHREYREETGYTIEVTGEVGQALEYRRKKRTKQLSHCFLANIIEQIGEPQFEEDEIADGLELQWVPFDDSVPLFEAHQPSEYDGTFIVPRDIALLREAQRSRAA